MSHKMEWLDEGDVVVDCVTPNENSLRVVFGDGRVFLLHCVVPILCGDSWDQGRLKAVCKSVVVDMGFLVPSPSTKWGQKTHKLVTVAKASTGENDDDASAALTALTVMSLAPLEQGSTLGSSRDTFKTPWLALIESGDGYTITVGIRNITPSQMTAEELQSRAQESSARETRKAAKQIASATKKISRATSRLSRREKDVRKRENALSNYIAIGATLGGAQKRTFTNKVRSFLQEATRKIMADPTMDKIMRGTKFPQKYEGRRTLIYDLLRAECGHAKKIDIAKKWGVEKRTLQRWTVPMKKTEAFMSFTTAVKNLVTLKNSDS